MRFSLVLSDGDSLSLRATRKYRQTYTDLSDVEEKRLLPSTSRMTSTVLPPKHGASTAISLEKLWVASGEVFQGSAKQGQNSPGR